MLKHLRYFVGFCLLSVLLSSCFESPSYTYEGPAVVEFKNQRGGFATQPANNVQNTVRARTVRQAIGRDSVLIQLVGPQRPTPLEVGYTIDATRSTAVEGVNYAVVGTKGSVTIPANSSSTYLVIRTLPGIAATAPATQTVSLGITLTGNEQVKPSENYKTFTFTIRN